METMFKQIETHCSWCGIVIKSGIKDFGISHGICENCNRDILEELEDEE